MKHTLKAIPIILLTLLLTSCTPNEYKETYFIHAVGFEKSENVYRIHTVCEKLQKKQQDFFTVSREGKSIEEATKKLMNDYEDCYFATAEIYLIPENADKKLINHLAKELCDSNIYPTKSSIIKTDENLKYFLGRIKSEDDLKRINKLTKKSRTNTIKHFSNKISGKTTDIPHLVIDNGKISLATSGKKDTDNKDKQNEKRN